MKPFVPAIAIVTVLLAACTSLSTTSVDHFTSENHNTVKGLVYYLPVGRIHIVGTLGKDSTTTDPANTNGAPAHPTPPGLVTESSTPTDANPKDKTTPDNPSITTQGGNSPFTITITADITADVNGGCFVKRDSNYIYDDTVDLKIDGATGLLSSGNVTSKDETAEVISDIVSDAMSIYTLKVGQVKKPSGLYPKPFDIIFYPRSVIPPDGGMSYDEAYAALADCGFILGDTSGSTEPIALAKDPNAHSESTFSNPILSNYHDGVAFRLAAPYSVVVKSNPINVPTMTILASRSVMLPGRQTYFLDYSRMPFVQKKTNLTFTNGMLTEYNQEVPSPIAGFLSIPKSIIQAVVPLPLGSSAPSSSGAGKGSDKSSSGKG